MVAADDSLAEQDEEVKRTSYYRGHAQPKSPLGLKHHKKKNVMEKVFEDTMNSELA